MTIEFTISTWDEIGAESQDHDLELDITEEEITAERINGELLLQLGFGSGLGEKGTWQEAEECWPVVASCRHGQAITMICHERHLAFVSVTWGDMS